MQLTVSRGAASLAAIAATFGLCAAVSLGAARTARGQQHPERHHEVLLWHSYGQAEERGLIAAVRSFEARHPDIRVRVSAIPWGAYATKLESAIPVSRGPDLFIDAHNRARAFLDASLIASFGELPGELESDLDPAHVQALTSGDVLCGVPISIKGTALFVNLDVAGGAPTDSLEDLEALADRLPRGTFPLAWDGDDAYQFAALLHAYGGEMLSEDGLYGFVGPQAEQASERLVELVRRGVIPDETSYDLVRDLFRSGRAATAISGPWFAYDLPPEGHWVVRAMPRVGATGLRMQSYATIEAAMIASTAREPEAARRLAVYLASADGALIRALEGRHIVTARSVWSDSRIVSDQRLVAFREAALDARIASSHRRMHSLFVPAERALRKILRGDASVRDALIEGQHRFEDDTREPPAPRQPLWGVIALGIFALWTAFITVQRARDPHVRSRLRASIPAYAWVAHAAIAVGFLVILPLLVGALTSFFAGHGRDLHYVGIANYVEILTARGGELLGPGSFWSVLLVTILWTIVNVALHVIIGVALALLLHRPMLRWKGVYRVLLILPWAVPSYVTALAWRGMFHRQFGAVNAMLDALGVEPISWFARWSTAFAANVATNVWLGFPFMMVVTLGALTSIPSDLYEAAALDGATRWQQFRFVTLPLLAPSLAPAIAMGAVWTFNMFNVVYLVSAGEPDGTTEILVSEAYRWAFIRGHQYGYAAAYAVLIFVLLLLGTRVIGRVTAVSEARR